MALEKKFNFMDDITFGDTKKAEEKKEDKNTEKPKTKQETAKRESKPSTDTPMIDMLNLNGKRPERMEIHKSFIIRPSLNDKFVAYAQKLDISENALFNKILERIFEE